jgi:imidazolonepropionase-like amidohydrolase
VLVDAGLTPYQALATGTRNVAEFLGTVDSTGTIAVGKRADLVLLFGNPLRDISHTAGPAGVMVGGHWIPRAEIEARLAAQALDNLEESTGSASVP